MNNQEKAWMLSGQRVTAYKSYRDRHNWKRNRIFEAKRVCLDQHKANAVEWSCDPEIKQLIKEQLYESLGKAYQGMSLTVACLKSLMAADRPSRDDYPMEETEEYMKRAIELMEEGE